jgi:DNA-binding LacI/PurR family transcriptional regulator
MANKSRRSLLMSNSDALVTDRVEQQIRKDLAELPATPHSRYKLPQERVIAEKYGVSRTTIRQVIRRLKRDHLVSSVWGKGTFVNPARKTARADVLLICNDPHNGYDMVAIGTLSSLIRQRDLVSNVVVSQDPLADWDHILQSYPDACGVVLIGPYSRENIEVLAGRCELPLVHIGDLYETIRGPAVCDNILNDNVAMAFQGTEYLIKQGHRNIAWLTWEKQHIWEIEAGRGYFEALKVHGIEPDETLIIPSVFRPEITPEARLRLNIALGLQKKEQWLARGKTPTALIHHSGTESWIRDLLHYCFKDFFRDDSIMAITYFEFLRPHFSGFRQAQAVCVKFEDLARQALDLLLRPRTGNERPRRETIEQTYFYRRTHGEWREEDPLA